MSLKHDKLSADREYLYGGLRNRVYIISILLYMSELLGKNIIKQFTLLIIRCIIVFGIKSLMVL